jgi:hypothetical protein
MCRCGPALDCHSREDSVSLEFPNRCPWCGHQHTTVTDMGAIQAPPAPGHTTICFQCVKVGVFARDALGVLMVRRPTPAESYLIHRASNIQLARALIVSAKAARAESEASSDGNN